MSVLYVKEQGSYLQKRGERLVVTKGKQILLEIPTAQVEDVAVFGNVQLTAQVRNMLLEKGISIHFFSFSGHYLGQAAAESSKNIFLRFAQYERYHQLPVRLSFARAIVKNKVENQIYLIRRHRFEHSDYAWEKDVEQMERLLKKLPEKSNANEIMGDRRYVQQYLFWCIWENVPL